MQVSTSTPAFTQNFGKAIFYNVPKDMQSVMNANKVFKTLASQQDVVVSARPGFKWSDPLGFRTPKADEKSWMSVEIQGLDADDIFAGRREPICTNNKMFAPLKDHVQTFLHNLEIDTLLDRFRY